MIQTHQISAGALVADFRCTGVGGLYAEDVPQVPWSLDKVNLQPLWVKQCKKMHVSPKNGMREHLLGEERTRCDIAVKMFGDCMMDHITTAESV